jgi:hypothetical protein
MVSSSFGRALEFPCLDALPTSTLISAHRYAGKSYGFHTRQIEYYWKKWSICLLYRDAMQRLEDLDIVVQWALRGRVTLIDVVDKGAMVDLHCGNVRDS